MSEELKPWRFYNLVHGAYEIAREGDYAKGTICCAHNERDAIMLVTALNFYETEVLNAR